MPASTRPVRLLIVDDEAAVVEELCEFFTDRGYHCTGTQSALQACEYFRNDPKIGVLLCDLHMPEMSGIELVQELERIANIERPVEAIILTGETESQAVIQAMRAGVCDYIQKPIDLISLLASVQRLEKSVEERGADYRQLGLLNEQIKSLAQSIDDIYQNIHRRRHHFESAAPTSHSMSEDAAATVEEDTPASLRALSPRQQAVARLVGKGLTNYQIACELGITENTVKLYVSQVLRLTHMSNRTQLALSLSPSSNTTRH